MRELKEFVWGMDVGVRVSPPAEEYESFLITENLGDYSWVIARKGFFRVFPMRTGKEVKTFRTLAGAKRNLIRWLEKHHTPRIVLNRIQTPDGTVLTSYHQHDYQSHIDRNGEEYFVDGGLSYLRRGGIGYTELSVTDDASFEVIRESLHWGKLTESGHQFVRLCDLETDHIKNIVEGGHGSEWVRRFMQQELEHREEN